MKAEKQKRPYDRPVLKVVNLAPQEVLSGGCKTDEGTDGESEAGVGLGGCASLLIDPQCISENGS